MHTYTHSDTEGNQTNICREVPAHCLAKPEGACEERKKDQNSTVEKQTGTDGQDCEKESLAGAVRGDSHASTDREGEPTHEYGQLEGCRDGMIADDDDEGLLHVVDVSQSPLVASMGLHVDVSCGRNHGQLSGDEASTGSCQSYVEDGALAPICVHVS